MIGKVGSSRSIGGTLDYLENDPDRVDWKEVQHLASDDPKFVRQQMESTAEMSRTDQPIYHYSISWDVDDNPNREQMQAVARQSLKDLGMEDHQALIVAHKDHDYKHLHVMANRVHPETGLAWSVKMDYKVLEKSLRRQERAHGWKEVPGHHYQLEGQRKPEYAQSLNRLEAAQVKNGQIPFYAQVQQVAETDFRQARSWEQMHNRLSRHGLTIQRGSRGTGGKVTDGHSYANLSKVHRDFSMGRLEKRLGNFQSLEQIRAGKNLSRPQKLFASLDKGLRLNNRKLFSQSKKGLRKVFKAAGTARKVTSMMQSMASMTLPGNPALGIAKKLAGKATSMIKQQSKTQGRGM